MDQFKDIYNDENVISSDEYDETDDDDLMNAAVSSATPKQESNKVDIPPQVLSIGERISRVLNEKKQKKQMHKIGLKLKKKSLSWMNSKFRRDKARSSYLLNLARAKSLKKPTPKEQHLNVEQKTDMEIYQPNEQNIQQNTTINVKETLPIAPEPEAPISTSSRKPQIETTHETIDLDDTDEDDFDEDDDSISNSSGDYDDQNNDDDDDEIDDDSQDDDENEETGNAIQEIHEDDKKDIENLITTVENKENGHKVEHNEENIQETVVETPTTIPIINNNEPEVTNFLIQQKEPEEEASTVIIHPNAIETQPKINTPPFMEMHEAPTINTGTNESNLNQNNNSNKQNNNNENNNEHLKDISSNNKDAEMTDITQDLGIEQSFFFNDELNVMYPTFDRIINEHVTFPETAEMLKRKVEFITADIDIIKKAREKAEQECNRLIFAQHAKEQILARVMRKIKQLEVNTENFDATEIENSAMRFIGQVPKETQTIRQPLPKKRKLEPKTVDELIAYRAAMSIDAINREKAQFNINPNSFLETIKNFENTPISKDFAFRNKREINRKNDQYFDANVTMEPKKSNFHNSQWKNSSINDILESSHIQKTKNFSHSSNILNSDDHHNDSIPFGLDNVSHSSALSKILNKSNQPSKKVINLNGEAYEIIIERKVPNQAPQLFPVLNQSNFHDETGPKRDETLVVHLDASDFEDKPHRKFRGDPNGNYTCQHCGKHEAQFVCADCENQWYCSRTCQVLAWDAHSDFCE